MYWQVSSKNSPVTETIMKYTSSKEFHDHLLAAIEKKRGYHLKQFEEHKSKEDKGAVDTLAWVYTLIKFGKENIKK